MAEAPTNKKVTRKPVEYRNNSHRFQVLATKRVNKTLKQIRLIGNLSGSGYDYTEMQVDSIRDALEAGIATAMSRFGRASKKVELFNI
jgi:hypothetical protein